MGYSLTYGIIITLVSILYIVLTENNSRVLMLIKQYFQFKLKIRNVTNDEINIWQNIELDIESQRNVEANIEKVFHNPFNVLSSMCLIFWGSSSHEAKMPLKTRIRYSRAELLHQDIEHCVLQVEKIKGLKSRYFADVIASDYESIRTEAWNEHLLLRGPSMSFPEGVFVYGTIETSDGDILIESQSSHFLDCGWHKGNNNKNYKLPIESMLVIDNELVGDNVGFDKILESWRDNFINELDEDVDYVQMETRKRLIGIINECDIRSVAFAKNVIESNYFVCISFVTSKSRVDLEKILSVRIVEARKSSRKEPLIFLNSNQFSSVQPRDNDWDSIIEARHRHPLRCFATYSADQ